MIFLLGFICGVIFMMVLRVILYRMNMIAYRKFMEKAEKRLNELVNEEMNKNGGVN